MYKVLLVDDEPLMRFALKNLIKWEKLGFSVIGEAENGLEAVQMIETEQPHLVFTDIKMPHMDGLELLKICKERNLSCRFVLLSNYDDFQLVQQALRLGANDYILKSTLNAQSLTTLLKKEEKHLSIRRADSVNDTSPIRSDRVSDDMLWEQLLAGASELLGVPEKEQACMQKLLRGTYGLAIIVKRNFFSMDSFNKRADENFSGIMKKVASNMLRGQGLCIHAKNTYILIAGREYFNISDPNNLIRRLLSMVKRYTNQECLAGIGGTGCRQADLRGLFDKALIAINQGFYSDAEMIQYQTTEKPECNIKQLYMDTLHKTDDGIAVHDWPEIVSVFYDALDEIKKNHLQIAVCKQFVFDVLSFLRGKIGERDTSLFEESKYHSRNMMEAIQNAASFAEVQQVVETLLEGLRKNFEACFYSYGTTVAKAIAYIHQHYGEKITLDMVAKYACVHPNYLSRIFAQETGKNFTSYLTEVRVEQAKTLLCESVYSVAEIGEKIGITNSKYFSSVFCKACGMSPQKYRDCHNKHKLPD